mgnify:CR=1 FL=1
MSSKINKSWGNKGILILPIFLAIAAGSVASYLGVGIVNIQLDKGFITNLFCLVQVSVIVLVWLFEASRSRFQSATLKVLVTAGLFLAISATWQEIRESLVLLFLLDLVFLALAVLSFFQLYLSFLITDVFVRSKLKRVMLLILMLICIVVSVTLSQRTLSSIHQQNNSLPSTGLWILTLFTSVPAIVISISGIVATRLSRYQVPQVFLRTWAIAISTFGNASFYNKNLANADFTGVDLSNIDLRASSLYRTKFRGAIGLEAARVNNHYLDLNQPKVRQLLTRGYSDETDFSNINLQGAYLQDIVMQRFNLIEANLNEADLRGADLRDSILVRSQANGADFSGANLTGVCIQDWSVNSETIFSGVQCDYVYREFQNNQPIDRYPSDRNFEPGEFESLFQKLTNAIELVFRDQIDWRALTFTFEKFRLEDDGMDLELKGIEQRGDYWIVKVTHREGVTKQQVERQVQSTYEDLRAILEAKDQQINRLLGIVEHQTGAMQQQAEALTNFSKQPFGNNFNIFGSTITNLAGSGQIDYQEASTGVRSLVTNSVNPDRTLQQLIYQLTYHNVATTAASQGELIQQVLLTEAESDPAFRAFLLEQGQQIIDRLPDGEIAIALQSAIRALQTG